MVIDGGLTFGQGLVDAYELESKTAVFPRIIVDDLVFEAMRAIPLLRAHDAQYETGIVKGLLRQDVDGMWFVDYLGYMFENADDDAQHVDLINRHKSMVRSQLSATAALIAGSAEQQGRVAKALWLKDYHNAHINRIDEILLKTLTGSDRGSLFA